MIVMLLNTYEDNVRAFGQCAVDGWLGDDVTVVPLRANGSYSNDDCMTIGYLRWLSSNVEIICINEYIKRFGTASLLGDQLVDVQ